MAGRSGPAVRPPAARAPAGRERAGRSVGPGRRRPGRPERWQARPARPATRRTPGRPGTWRRGAGGGAGRSRCRPSSRDGSDRRARAAAGVRRWGRWSQNGWLPPSRGDPEPESGRDPPGLGPRPSGRPRAIGWKPPGSRLGPGWAGPAAGGGGDFRRFDGGRASGLDRAAQALLVRPTADAVGLLLLDARGVALDADPELRGTDRALLCWLGRAHVPARTPGSSSASSCVSPFSCRPA